MKLEDIINKMKKKCGENDGIYELYDEIIGDFLYYYSKDATKINITANNKNNYTITIYYSDTDYLSMLVDMENDLHVTVATISEIDEIKTKHVYDYDFSKNGKDYNVTRRDARTRLVYNEGKVFAYSMLNEYNSRYNEDNLEIERADMARKLPGTIEIEEATAKKVVEDPFYLFDDYQEDIMFGDMTFRYFNVRKVEPALPLPYGQTIVCCSDSTCDDEYIFPLSYDISKRMFTDIFMVKENLSMNDIQKGHRFYDITPALLQDKLHELEDCKEMISKSSYVKGKKIEMGK